MRCATPAQSNSLPTKLLNTTFIQPDFFKHSESDFRSLHLHNLESLLRYHFTLHSQNLIFTTLLQFDFRVLHLYNLKSLSSLWNDIFHATLAHPNFHYIRKNMIPVAFSFLLCVHILLHIHISYLNLCLNQVVAESRND